MKPKKKTNKALWTGIYPDQARKLRPERTEAGGVKARSGGEAARMAVYGSIADFYKQAHPYCEAQVACYSWGETSDIHHRKGREGLLLFDTRYFLAVCRRCHEWIHRHPKEAKAKGLSL